MYTEFNEFFTPEEIQLVQNFKRKAHNHPLKEVLIVDDSKGDSNNSLGYVIANTRRSFRSIYRQHDAWVRHHKHRLLNEDHKESSGALAELRAFGFLTLANFNILPQAQSDGEQRADFIVEQGQEKVIVEVTTKNFELQEEIALESFIKESTASSEPGISVRTHPITPFGNPTGEHENTTTKAIRKLSRIKSSSSQFSQKYPSIIWIDFQSEAWRLLSSSHCAPILSGRGVIHSGEFWYAFYGEKGMPVYEHVHITPYAPLSSRVKPLMLKNFFQIHPEIDAAILSFPSDTIIFENPDSGKPIPDWFWKRSNNIPHFNLERSRINWPGSSLRERLSLDSNCISSYYQIWFSPDSEDDTKKASGLSVDHELKTEYLGLYSNWINLKYQLFGSLKLISDRIWDFSVDVGPGPDFSKPHIFGDALLAFALGNKGNIQTAWRILCNSHSKIYGYLESAQAWYELFKITLSESPPREERDGFEESHLLHRLNQKQQNLLHEMETSLVPGIVFLVTIPDKIAHIIVRSFWGIFPDYNYNFVFTAKENQDDTISPDSIQAPSNIKFDVIKQTLFEDEKFSTLVDIISYFSDDDNFVRIVRFRDEYLFGFGQRLGHRDVEINLPTVFCEPEFRGKPDPFKHAYRQSLNFSGPAPQHWSHEDLLHTTVLCWNKSIEIIEAVFDELNRLEGLQEAIQS